MAFSNDFVEKLVLLIATAALSGFSIPYILNRIELQRAAYEKDRDAERSRQEKVIQAQSEFLDKLTDTLWRWRYMAVRVTYEGGSDDASRYDSAAQDYAEKFWTLLHTLRVEISKAYRLVSADQLTRLKSFYSVIVKLDLELRAIASETDPVQKKFSYMDMNHRLFSAVSDDIDHLVEDIAKDLRLVKTERS